MFERFFPRRPAGDAALRDQVQHLLPPVNTIVVPAAGAHFSLRAIKAACRIAALNRQCQIRLIYLVEVPWALSMVAAPPGEETLAETVLEAGAQLVESFGFSASVETQRGRDTLQLLLRTLTQQAADLVVLGGRSDGTRGVPLDLALQVCERAPCRVLLDYIAGDRLRPSVGETPSAAAPAA